MDKERSLRGLRIVIVAGFLLLITLTLFLLHTGQGRSSQKAVSENSSSSTISTEQSGQNIEKDKTKKNEQAQNGTTKIEDAKDKTSGGNTTNATKEEGKVSMHKPAAVASDDPFAVFNNSLFIGDSRTEGFKLYAGVNNASYFCLKAMTVDEIADGKTVSMSGQNVSVYDLLENSTYDKIFIAVGLNELGWNHIETFIEKYGQLIDNIKKKQPNAVIYLQAVLPVSREKDAADKVHNNAQIYWYNTSIVQLAEDKGVLYINPASAVVDADGFLLNEATTDGVHLNSEYCKKLAVYMTDMI